jgi:hypothetical protein
MACVLGLLLHENIQVILGAALRRYIIWAGTFRNLEKKRLLAGMTVIKYMTLLHE